MSDNTAALCKKGDASSMIGLTSAEGGGREFMSCVTPGREPVSEASGRVLGVTSDQECSPPRGEGAYS